MTKRFTLNGNVSLPCPVHGAKYKLTLKLDFNTEKKAREFEQKLSGMVDPNLKFDDNGLTKTHDDSYFYLDSSVELPCPVYDGRFTLTLKSYFNTKKKAKEFEEKIRKMIEPHTRKAKPWGKNSDDYSGYGYDYDGGLSGFGL